jgi:solute:Na+ symporter, SSS family
MLDRTVFLVFLILLIALGFSKRAKSGGEYLMGKRQTGLLGLVATLVMTEFNSATLIAFCSVGSGASYLPLIFLIGLLFYAAVVAKKWKEYNGFSVAGYFTKRYGVAVGKLASGALLLAMIGFNATYIKSLYLFLGALIPGGEWIGTALLTLMAISMSARGGLGSVIRTDLVSFFVILAFFPLLAIFGKGGGEVGTIDPRFLISLIVLTMFTYILAPWYGQKMFAARTKKVAFWGAVIAALIVFGLYELAVFATRGTGGDSALPAAIARLPAGVRGVGYGVIFATSATTLTGAWSAMTAMVLGDFSKVEGDWRRPFWITVLLAATSFVLANVMVDKVLDNLILANIPVAALAFALLGGFYWKSTSKMGAIVSIIVGLMSGISAALFCGPLYTWYWAMGGIPLTFISGIIASKFFPDRKLAQKPLS